MNYILDACVVSELTKLKPDKRVKDWFSQCDEEQLYISCLTLGELSFGIEMVQDQKKKNDLIAWYHRFVEAYGTSTLPVTDSICVRWGREHALHRKKGLQVPVIDGLIACTAIEYNYTLATRKIPDFEIMNVQLFNPWE